MIAPELPDSQLGRAPAFSILSIASSDLLESIVTIYVGNLSFQATEDDLRDVFADYGEVKRISLPIDRDTGRKRGFAFVEMSEEAHEDAAISELDGAEWLGRELRVNKARPRNEGGSSNRSDFDSKPFTSNPL